MLPMTAREAHMLFSVVNARHERGSILATTNKGVAAWGDYLADPTLAAAAPAPLPRAEHIW